MAKLGFKKSLILFCQDELHIEGLAWSGFQYLPLSLDKQFFYFLVFWFRLADLRAVISYVRFRPKADISDRLKRPVNSVIQQPDQPSTTLDR